MQTPRDRKPIPLLLQLSMFEAQNASLLWLCLGSVIITTALGLAVGVMSARLDAGKTVPPSILVGIVVGLGLGGWVDYQKSSQPDQTPQATSTSPTAISSSPSPTPPLPSASSTSDQTPQDGQSETEQTDTPTPAPARAESDLPAAPTQYYLADLPTVKVEKEGRAGQCTGGCTGFHQGAGRIQGKVYPNSYLMEVAADGRRSVATWNLARSCSSLSLTVGLDDLVAPAAQVTFTLSTDGASPQELATVELATPGHVADFPVDGVAQIEIAAHVSGSTPDSAVDILLGDARLTCAPSSLGDDS